MQETYVWQHICSLQLINNKQENTRHHNMIVAQSYMNLARSNIKHHMISGKMISKYKWLLLSPSSHLLFSNREDNLLGSTVLCRTLSSLINDSLSTRVGIICSCLHQAAQCFTRSLHRVSISNKDILIDLNISLSKDR